jgi:rRNA biogenesis protein RRP5
MELYNLTHDPQEMATISQHYPLGAALECTVLDVDAAQHHLNLALASLAPTTSKSFDELEQGDVVTARIKKLDALGGLLVQLINSNVQGRVYLTDISDEYKADMLQDFKEQQIITCMVIGKNDVRKTLDLSTRPSRLQIDAPVVDAEISEFEQLSEGQVVRGFVNNMADKKGCFISLNSKINAQVKISNLSDDFVMDWKKLYSIGQLVKGRILT